MAYRINGKPPRIDIKASALSSRLMPRGTRYVAIADGRVAFLRRPPGLGFFDPQQSDPSRESFISPRGQSSFVLGQLGAGMGGGGSVINRSTEPFMRANEGSFFSQTSPLSPSWLEACDLARPEKDLIQRVIDGAEWDREPLVSELNKCEFSPREIYLWMEQIEKGPDLAEMADLVYPRMQTGLATINNSHLPREQKYQLLMGIACAKNPYLSAYDEQRLKLALGACSNSGLSPQGQVNLLVALAGSQGTRVIQAYESLDRALPTACAAFTNITQDPFIDNCRALDLAVNEFQSRSWDNCLTDRTLVLLMERLEHWFSGWVIESLKPTLDVLQSDGRTPQDQLRLLVALSRVTVESEIALSDSVLEVCSFSQYCLNPVSLSKALSLTKILSTELGLNKALMQREVSDPTDSSAFIRETVTDVKHELVGMMLYPAGEEPDGLFTDLVNRAQESLWVAVDLIEALNQEGASLPEAHSFVAILLPRIPSNIRLYVIRELLTNHVSSIVADPRGYYNRINGLGAELMRFLSESDPEKKLG